MNKTISITVIVLVVIIGGYFLFRGGYKAPKASQPQLDVPASSKAEEAALAVNEFSMVSGNLFFSPKNLTLAKDQPVKITFQNTGTHTFTVDELGVNIRLQGSSAVAEFTPTKAGTFEYYCPVPGHREGGMFGSLLVE